MPKQFEDTLQRIRVVLEKSLGSPVKAMTEESDLLADLGFQSIQIVQLFIELQAEFQIKLDADDYLFENVATVGSIRELVDRHRSLTE